MTVDLSVLESLGINLYSNAAAVLSELVANAYDADATLVNIDWKQSGERVIVEDDGVGMTAEELNDRFLKVGYKKRDHGGPAVGQVEAAVHGPQGYREAFGVLDRAEGHRLLNQARKKQWLSDRSRGLEQDINAGKTYHPEPVEVPADTPCRAQRSSWTNSRVSERP